MYTGEYAQKWPEQPAIIMASSGEVVTYDKLDKRANKLAHLFRSLNLKHLDHIAIMMENNSRYIECCSGADRTGLYYTCINNYLTAEEIAYIFNNSESQVLITSMAKKEVALEALKSCPNAKLGLIVDGPGDGEKVLNLDEAVAAFPDTPIEDQQRGLSMLYSSGTTGHPKGILRPNPVAPPEELIPLMSFLKDLWHYEEGMIYLSPAPLYHAAPSSAVSLTMNVGGTAIIMESFDPEQYLSLVEKYKVTHSQLVPTMFSRMLKLPDNIRTKYDLSSLKVAIHAAAPCPVQVKEQMIEWWGPIIDEYYGATEGLGFATSNSDEWIAHKGSVGKIILGDLHILDDDMQPCPQGTSGTIWFKTATPFEYFNDPEKTAEARSADGSMSTVGDVGYVDEDGFLYLTDRATFMIVSGGVNIYPQESENLLITHPKVADAAVFGVPNEDFGEEVKAVVQPMPGVQADEKLSDELIAFCLENLSKQKCPRSIDYLDQLPRLPTGKLYKRVLRDKYWEGQTSKI